MLTRNLVAALFAVALAAPAQAAGSGQREFFIMDEPVVPDPCDNSFVKLFDEYNSGLLTSATAALEKTLDTQCKGDAKCRLGVVRIVQNCRDYRSRR